MIERIASAKINLSLHVTGQREDGYHLLDSLVVFAEYGDVIRVSKPHHAHGPVEMKLDGEFGDALSAGPENLVTSAALLLRQQIIRNGGEPQPVSIQLDKNLPIASGLGGGSADAAATLLALKEFWQVDQDVEGIAKSLGADVLMCLHSRPLRAQGVGDAISVLNLDEPFNLVLVNPGIAVSTPDIFKNLKSKNNLPLEGVLEGHMPPLQTILTMRNDLQNPAICLVPEIQEVLSEIADTRAIVSRMSGSGATCFGIYQTADEADEACAMIKNKYPSWWCVSTQTTQ